MVEKAAMKLEYGDITWDSSFNLTTSYRRDSDIPRPFGNLQVLLGNSFDLLFPRVFPIRKFTAEPGITRLVILEVIFITFDQFYSLIIITNNDIIGFNDLEVFSEDFIKSFFLDKCLKLIKPM